MKCNLMPYGKPMFFNGSYRENKTFPLYVQRLKCSFELKNGFLPMIQIKDAPLQFKGNEYLESSDGMRVELTLTNVDLKLFFEHYDVINPEFIDGFMFKGAHGLYDAYVDKFMEEKVKYDKIPSKRLKAKLLLNNLYGKTGSAIDVTGRIPVLGEDGIVRLVVGEYEEGEPEYVATASFTTAYARNLIIRTCQMNYDRFIYCDTDSMHLIGVDIPKEMIKNNLIHKTELGKFDLEHVFVQAIYLFQKTYIYQLNVCSLHNEDNERVFEDDSVIVTGAGMTAEVKKHLNFSNFKPGVTVPGLKKSKTVVGGAIIEDKLFTLRERMSFK